MHQIEVTDSIAEAIAGVEAFIEDIKLKLAAKKLLTDEEALGLTVVIEEIVNLRNSMILFDLAGGMSGKAVAKRYHLTEARISQIKKSIKT